MRVLAGLLVLSLASIEASAQTPQPFPAPRPPQPTTQPAGAQAAPPPTQKPPTTQKPATPAPAAPAPAAAGTPAAQKTQVQALIPILNSLGLDAMTAHWEFAYGPETFKQRAAKLRYPMLAIPRRFSRPLNAARSSRNTPACR